MGLPWLVWAAAYRGWSGLTTKLNASMLSTLAEQMGILQGLLMCIMATECSRPYTAINS